MPVGRYIPKKLEIRALKITADNKKTLVAFLGTDTTCYVAPGGVTVDHYEKGYKLAAVVPTVTGPATVVEGEYVVQTEAGFLKLSAAEFEANYEPVTRTFKK